MMRLNIFYNKINVKEANDEIERNKLFKPNIPNKEDRSLMNVCWVFNEEYKQLEEEFLAFAKTKSLVGIKGHRSAGGFRASLYNALPKESVIALIDAMKEFEQLKSK